MINIADYVRTLTYVQKNMLRKIGDSTWLLAEITVGSKPDTVRILKSLFYFVHRMPNSSFTFYRYRLNDMGLAALGLIGLEDDSEGDADPLSNGGQPSVVTPSSQASARL